MIIRKLTFLVVSTIFVLTACAGNGRKIKWENVDSMTYHFEGIHFQPEMQRNYSITLTPEKVSVTIDSYGSLVMREEFKNTPEKFQQAINVLKANGLKPNKIKESDPYQEQECHHLMVYSADQVVFKGYCFDGYSTFSYKEDPIKATSVFLNAVPKKIDSMVEESRKPKEKPIKKCNINWDEVDCAEYKHSTGTIAPEYYRSYLISITPDSMVLTVYDYSEKLLRHAHPNTPEAFKTFLEKCKEQGYYSTEEQDFRTGGSYEMVGFYKGNKALFKRDTEYGLSTKKGGIGQAFLAVFPESVHDAIESTMKHR